MEFKTKEKMKKEHWYDCGYPPNCSSYDKGVEDAFKSFAKRIEFYTDYSFDEGYYKLKKEQPKVLKLFHIWFEKNHLGRFDAYYTDWLFNYCFGDVIE